MHLAAEVKFCCFLKASAEYNLCVVRNMNKRQLSSAEDCHLKTSSSEIEEDKTCDCPCNPPSYLDAVNNFPTFF